MTHEQILVTGSSGLIGTALCAALAAQGHGVQRFDLRDRAGHAGDIRTPADLDQAMRGCTGVVHLAAISRVIWGERDPEGCHQTNVIGTRNVIESARNSRLKPWLIFGSSREVYGQSPVLPVTEGAALAPLNHYARSKVAAEAAVRQAAADGMRAAILRFSTVYGAPADHADRVIPAFCRAAILDQPLRIEGAATCLDISHVSDVAQGICATAAGLAQGRALAPMHLTTGSGVMLTDLARRVRHLANSRSETTVTAGRAYDVAQFVGDPGLARAQIGWQPSVPLAEGLAALISHYQTARLAG